MVSHKSQLQLKITTDYSGSSYEFINDQFLSGQITRLENGFDTAVLVAHDTESLNWLSRMDAGENVKIEAKDKSDSSYVTVFDGLARFVSLPISESGEVLQLNCDGSGYGFGETACGQEYGTESSNPTLDTIKEILEDATNGIIPKWINKLLGTATDSGYSYTTEIEDIAGSIKYLYFPYKPCNKVIQDVCEVVQAIKGTNAGPHWIVTTGGKLLVSTIGAHHAGAISEDWTNYFLGSQANSTLEQEKDFTEFWFQKLEKEANYILYHGKFKRPSTGDFFTENQSGLWGVSHANLTLSDDSTDYKVGSYSLKGSTTQSGASLTMFYPSNNNWLLDITKIGGKHNIPVVNFFARKNSEVTNVIFIIWFQGGGTAYRLLTLTNDVWSGFSFSLGPYQNTAGNSDPWTYSGASDWTNINSMRLQATYPLNANNKYHWIDGFHISGWVVRAARQSGAYSSSDPVKLKIITDHVGKDDFLRSGTPGTTDVGTIARLAKAEYLRASTTPIVGFFTTPFLKDLLPGQLVHVHAKKKSDGTFNINKDFRVTKLIHTFGKNTLTKVFVTDDVKNSNVRSSFNSLNTVLAAARPEFQDRQASSIKSREVDITQPILEESY